MANVLFLFLKMCFPAQQERKKLKKRRKENRRRRKSRTEEGRKETDRKYTGFKKREALSVIHLSSFQIHCPLRYL